mmetsp:Transcript_33728/g.84986  ORF Transcript_33728/g.84986 Transcript_33728/m.84986 type:complete len:150 (-) Transcript_33728:29-478(-)
MPKRIEGPVQQWQVPEVAAAAFSAFLRWGSAHDVSALETSCAAAYTIGCHACEWAATEARDGAPAREPLPVVVEPWSWQGVTDVRVPITGTLLEQLCLVLGHCHQRADDSADLASMARTAARVLHIRAANDLDSQGEVLTTALLQVLAE